MDRGFTEDRATENFDFSIVRRKIFISLFSIAVLLAVYLFQEVNLIEKSASLLRLPAPGESLSFIIRKTMRLIVNDAACLLLIATWFPEKPYRKLALMVFLAEVFFLLPLYLIIKLHVEGPTEISSPLLSQFHRLLVNPLLMMLLMVGFVYQKIRLKSDLRRDEF